MLSTRRRGTCQPEQCGSACCTSLHLFQPAMGAEERAFYKARGVRLLEGFPGGAVAVKVEQRCQHLTSAGQCAIYGTPDRPGGCEAFPTYEFELIGVEGCSYEFAEV